MIFQTIRRRKSRRRSSKSRKGSISPDSQSLSKENEDDSLLHEKKIENETDEPIKKINRRQLRKSFRKTSKRRKSKPRSSSPAEDSYDDV